tara:strand:- start:462 stop:743 length:282 start_codon:yes stop_codon:yes gene_type:complete
MLKNNVIKDTKKVVEYLTKKQAWEHGYIRYSNYRKMIAYVCGYNKVYFIRKIFLYMVEEELFIRKKTDKRSYLYKFKNPNEMTKINKTITITF